MENKKHIENEDEIDVRKIYLRNFKPHQPRVGKQYQAIIPECISAPKKKESQKSNDNHKVNNINENDKNKKDISKPQIVNNNVEKEIKNDIIGHKTTYKKKNKDEEEEEEEDEYVPKKKKKINNDI